MPRATICVDSGAPEQTIVEAWLDRRREQLAFASEDEGCGCCVHLWRVEASRKVLDELPPAVFASSEWSPMYGATNPVVVSAAEAALTGQTDLERFEWFKKCAPHDFVDQDVGQLRALYLDGDELFAFRGKLSPQDAGYCQGYALVRNGKVVGAAVVSRQS
jgi:hypothetical protein